MDELLAAHHLVCILLESISPRNIWGFILSVGVECLKVVETDPL